MILEENFILSNGLKIPKIGLGTWLISNEDVPEVVKTAIDVGYRHIDTAQAYKNEEGVGRGIKESGVKRGDIFVTTKLAAELKSFEKAKSSIDASLDKLGMDHIDLMIIHSPQPWAEFGEEDRYPEGNRQAWKALEEAYKEGKLKSIGLSNFQINDVKNIIDACDVKPMVNQILAHIGNTPEKLIQYCKDQDILVEAYSPIGHGKIMKNDEVASMAEKYGVSVPQLGIRYCLELGMLPLPKSSNPDHIKANTKVDFEISDEDMERLKSIKKIDYEEAKKFAVYNDH